MAAYLIGLSVLAGAEAFAQEAQTPVSPPVSTPDLAAQLGAPVVLARTAEFTVEGPGGAFAVQVAWPDVPPPPEGYGAIYAMDAGWSFGTLRDVLRLQGSVPTARGVGPTIIVAVGWPTPDLLDMARRGPDLVGPDLEGRTAQGASAAATLRVLTDTIIPRVEAALPVNPKRRMVVGHSYGGAFALRAGRARPDLFSHVAAGSPSLWTDPEAFFAPGPRLGPAPGPRTLITIGALERPDAARAAGEDPARVARLAARDMAGRAEALAAQIGAQFTVIEGQSHGGALAPFLALAPAFLWR